MRSTTHSPPLSLPSLPFPSRAHHRRYEFFADELPIWGFVGPPPEQTKGDETVYIYTHKTFDIAYNGDRVGLLRARGWRCCAAVAGPPAAGRAAGAGPLLLVAGGLRGVAVAAGLVPGCLSSTWLPPAAVAPFSCCVAAC